MNSDPRLPPRFWSKVQLAESGCWLWTAATTGGYGMFGMGGRSGRMYRAHRVAYEALIGPIPDGLQLDHLCRVRNCVNPDHLEPVTLKVNVLRGESSSAERARQTHCIAGHLFDEKNTGLIRQGNAVYRRCQACNRERQRRFREAKRAA